MKTQNQKPNATDARQGRVDAAPSASAAVSSAAPTLNAGPEEFISKTELASRLKVTVRTISNWQRRGIVPFVKCRRAIYYDWPAVTAHLRTRASLCKQPQDPLQLLRIPVIGTAGDGNRKEKPND